jgi:hypothetical protein
MIRLNPLIPVDIGARPNLDLDEVYDLRYRFWPRLLNPVVRFVNALRDKKASPWRAVFLRYSILGEGDGEKL